MGIFMNFKLLKYKDNVYKPIFNDKKTWYNLRITSPKAELSVTTIKFILCKGSSEFKEHLFFIHLHYRDMEKANKRFTWQSICDRLDKCKAITRKSPHISVLTWISSYNT